MSLARRDLETRDLLAAEGSLYAGYHAEMERVHRENAAALERILDEVGWPGVELAGEDGAEAAWLIAQHAIGSPAFQRRCLAALEAAAAANKVPAWQPAMLLDRIRVFEGRPQVYGTSFDWDEQGLMSPLPIEEARTVDERRAAVGLPPLAEAIVRHREQAVGEPQPSHYKARRREMEAWARRVGWR
ncbi:MAG: hypothetical protein M3177_02110 [Pseudomonadota bacterium]|nr:hypothetical protein [Pseudomonadota bacterium]